MELVTIKWLLVAILVCVLVIAVSFAVLAVISILSYGLIKENQKGVVFQKLAERHLSNGNNQELIELANDRIKTSPQDYSAYWYLGKVQYHEGEYIKAKRSFQKVIELDPEMDYSAGQWLDDISEKIEQGPQLVK